MTFHLWQALLAAELNPIKGRVLLRELGPNRNAGIQELLASTHLTPAERKRVQSASLESANEAEKRGIRVVSFGDYPEVLRAWNDNPLALFVDGDWSSASRPAIGIVGTRGATAYGKAVATKFAEVFARAGVTVVSGGAIGIDAAAHKGAISAGGQTIAVMAGGIDRLYPAQHRGLFQQIRESGCLVSQFACGTKPEYFRFLIRNHLVAALSQVLVVIEAPERSGAMSTAFRANELGRHVFVVPANIENVNFRGSHSLIRDGATLVDHPAQVLEDLGVELPELVQVETPVNPIAAKILKVLSTDPMPTELIVERSGYPMSDVLSELTMLELDGRIIREPSGYILKP